MSFICRRNISPPLNVNPYQDLQEANKRVQPEQKQDDFLKREKAMLTDLRGQIIHYEGRPPTHGSQY